MRIMGIDDFLKAIQEDEQHDRVATQTKATPIDYARSRGIAPQKVYKSLRLGKLQWHGCECGRRVIDIAEADELYGFVEEVEDATDEGADPESD